MPILPTDLLAPFDPTGFDSISGSQLLQFLQGSYPQADKGINILTTDVAGNPVVPDASVITKWKRYIWLRQSVSSLGMYVWNDNAASDVVYLKWQSVNISGIAAGSIMNFMIADNTIQDVKIANLSYSKLTGAPTGLSPSGAAGGVLTGTYPNPSIGNQQITTAMIALLNITNGLIADATIGIAKFAPFSGSYKDMIRVNAAVTGVEVFTPPTVFTSGVVVTTSNAGKIPRVLTAGAGDTGTWEMVAPSGANLVGDVLQTLAKVFAASDSTATAIPFDNTIPQSGEGKEYATLAITPKSATSLLHIKFKATLAANNNNVTVTLALFKDADVDALQAIPVGVTSSSVTPMGEIDFWIVSGSTAARTYKIRFGPDTNTGYINRASAGDKFNGVLTSFLSIEEVVGTLS